MKYNERFSKEEITHFDRKIQELVTNFNDEWQILVKRLRPTKIGPDGEKKPGLYRHYAVITYLYEKFKFTEKTAYRFINYVVLTPWFKVYSAETNDSFEFNCSYMLLSKMMTSSREQAMESEETSPNKYIDSHKGLQQQKDKVNVVVKFATVYNDVFLVDFNGNFWPIELAK